MAAAIRGALADESLRRNLSDRGRVQVRQFTWERAAAQLLEYLTGRG